MGRLYLAGKETANYKMVIINVSGGLGNQLFQYALYKKFELTGRQSFLDKTDYGGKRGEKRIYYLDALDPHINYCTKSDRKKYSNNNATRIGWKLQQMRGLKSSHKYEKEPFSFDSTILETDGSYLTGYWQNERYFSDIRKYLIDSLKFPVEESERADMIRKKQSVSIHVRRGDYVQYSAKYGNICTMEYYQKAIAYIESCCDVEVYCVFSDDIEWCKRNLRLSHCIYMENSCEETACNEMKLMSLCKHNIIANSSFSWWGAWLNENSDKIVVSPGRWLNGRETEGIWCDNWVKIPV